MYLILLVLRDVPSTCTCITQSKDPPRVPGEGGAGRTQHRQESLMPQEGPAQKSDPSNRQEDARRHRELRTATGVRSIPSVSTTLLRQRVAIHRGGKIAAAEAPLYKASRIDLPSATGKMSITGWHVSSNEIKYSSTEALLCAGSAKKRLSGRNAEYGGQDPSYAPLRPLLPFASDSYFQVLSFHSLYVS